MRALRWRCDYFGHLGLAACLALPASGCFLTKTPQQMEIERAGERTRRCDASTARMQAAREELRSALHASATVADPHALAKDAKPRDTFELAIEPSSWACEAEPEQAPDSIPFDVQIGSSPFRLKMTPVSKVTLAQARAKTIAPLDVEILARPVHEVTFHQHDLGDERLRVTLVEGTCGSLTYQLGNRSTAFLRVRTVSVHLGAIVRTFRFEEPLLLPPSAAEERVFDLASEHAPIMCPELQDDGRTTELTIAMSVEYLAEDKTQTVHKEALIPFSELLKQ